MDAVAGILARTEHRPWPVPDRPWIMRQTWRDLAFLHWSCDAELLRPHVPAGLELDTFDGRAWIGVVPFHMTGIRLRGLPPVPGTHAFAELNVRTYVRGADRAGVWFFSLDAASTLAVEVARAWFHLPYFRASMRTEERDGRIEYASERRDRRGADAELVARYRGLGPAPAARGSLEHWLTERYCLFASRRGSVVVADIHHVPWPLERAEVDIERCTMTDGHGVSVAGRAPLAHFAKRLDVVVWAPRPFTRAFA
jgi:uncharacterized protein YqjF (DUF2071 family)